MGQTSSQAPANTSSAFHNKPFEDKSPVWNVPDKTFEKEVENSFGAEAENLGSGWEVEDDWGGDVTGNHTEPTSSVDVKSSFGSQDREAKKAELLRKREERKQQRERANLDKKSKSGALKLGGVKKVTRDPFD